MCRPHIRSPERATPSARGKNPPRAGCQADPAKNNLVEKPLPTVATNREQGRGGGWARASTPPPAGEDFPRVTLNSGQAWSPGTRAPRSPRIQLPPEFSKKQPLAGGLPPACFPKRAAYLRKRMWTEVSFGVGPAGRNVPLGGASPSRLQADTWSSVSGRGPPRAGTKQTHSKPRRPLPLASSVTCRCR